MKVLQQRSGLQLVHPPRQGRSQDTALRLIEAARRRLARRDFEDVTVAEIAADAGVSIGGFYARFASKEALLLHLCDDGFVTQIAAAVEELLRPERWAKAEVADVVRAYITLTVRMFRRHREILQQVALHSRLSRDAAFQTRVQRFNRNAHDQFRSLLMARSDQIGHSDPRLAIDLGLTFVSAAMRECILFSHARPQFIAMSDSRLIDELTRAYCAYLCVPCSTLGTTRRAANGKTS